MKNKTKLVVGLSALLAVTAGAAATGTVAWFSTTRTVTVNVTNIGVYSDTGSLSIAPVAIDSSATKSGSSLVGTTTSMTDISGDGKSFYKPHWKLSQEGSQAEGMYTIENGKDLTGNASAGKAYYVNFALTFTNGGTSNFKVYLNNDSVVNPTTESTVADKQLARSTRIAFFADGTNHAAGDAICSWQPYAKHLNASDVDTDNTAASNNFIKAQTNVTGIYGVANYVLATTTSDMTNFNSSLSSITSTTDGTNHPSQLVCSVAGNGSTTVVVRIWSEGTMEASTNKAKTGNIQAELSFVAVGE